jgi:hypothetical protein
LASLAVQSLCAFPGGGSLSGFLKIEPPSSPSKISETFLPSCLPYLNFFHEYRGRFFSKPTKRNELLE